MTTDADEVQVPALPTPVVAAPTPVVPEVKPDPTKPDPAKPDTTDSGVIEYEPIENDPGLTMALQFVGKHGIGPDSPEMAAALKGDFTFLKAKLAAAGAAGYEHYVALAEKSWEKHVAVEAESITKTAALIHTAVGGEEQWQTIQKWAGENADPEEKAAINTMLNAGGFQARAAASLLKQMHAAAAGTVVNPAEPVAGAVASGGGAAVATALSPAAYAKEVAALTAKIGSQAAGRSPELEALRQRRMQYTGN